GGGRRRRSGGKEEEEEEKGEEGRRSQVLDGGLGGVGPSGRYGGDGGEGRSGRRGWKGGRNEGRTLFRGRGGVGQVQDVQVDPEERVGNRGGRRGEGREGQGREEEGGGEEEEQEEEQGQVPAAALTVRGFRTTRYRIVLCAIIGGVENVGKGGFGTGRWAEIGVGCILPRGERRQQTVHLDE
ncbi:hypothetical protein ACHAWF_007142, partial [Thalassiosira exigua]